MGRVVQHGRNVHILVQHLQPDSLRDLSLSPAFAWLSPVPTFWAQAMHDAALELFGTLSATDKIAADREASRLLNVHSIANDDLINHARVQLAGLADVPGAFPENVECMRQIVWLYVHVQPMFDQLESIYLARYLYKRSHADDFRLHHPGASFTWDEAKNAAMREAVIRILKIDPALQDSCLVSYFAMSEFADVDLVTFDVTHYVVVQHPGRMRALRQIKDNHPDLLVFTPALDATVLYHPDRTSPDKATISILLDSGNAKIRRELADAFDFIAFGERTGRAPLDLAYYDLDCLRATTEGRTELRDVPCEGAQILHAWISRLTLSLGQRRVRMTLEADSDTDIWRVAEEEGLGPVLLRSGTIYSATMCLWVKLRGDSSARALVLQVVHRGAMSMSESHDIRLRRVAFNFLHNIGIYRQIDGRDAGSSPSLFAADLALLDIEGTVADGYLLRRLNLDARELLDSGRLTSMRFADKLVTPIEDHGIIVGYQHLDIAAAQGEEPRAVEPTSGLMIPIEIGDLQAYRIERAWILDQLMARLRAGLQDVPIVQETSEPYLLGYYGADALPVYLATRLWHPKRDDHVDVELRRREHRIGILLTTASVPQRRMLGRCLVVPIHKLLSGRGSHVNVDLRRLEETIRHWLRPERLAAKPRLIDDARGAILVGPWPEPWDLTNRKLIAIVRTLVDAYLAGHPVVTNVQLIEVIEDRHSIRTLFERARESRWQTYIRPADNNKHARCWELNIGPRRGQGELPLTSSRE